MTIHHGEAVAAGSAAPAAGRIRRSTPRLAVAWAVVVAAAASTLSITASQAATPPPGQVSVTSPSASPLPDTSPPSNQADLRVDQAPCAAVLQILQTWQLTEPQAPIPASAAGGAPGNGDLLVTGLNDRGEVWVDRLDPSVNPPAVVREEELKYPLPYAPGFPLASLGRIVASPDGRAVAVEEGDLGQAGCGEPLVLLSVGGIRRPFPVGAFQAVTDLAWAADGSALYGVRRPTIDASGRPYFDSDSGEVLDGPGTLLRWDSGTGQTTDLGTPCGSCGPLFVSPDGTRIATNDDSSIMVRDPDGGWRTVATGNMLNGWSDDEALVVHGARLSLDGALLNSWHEPCCHGTGYSGLLSWDGTTIAGMTLSDDFLSWQVVLLDVRDGSSRVVWSAPDVRGCTAFSAGSSGRADCDATSSTAPGATIDPVVAISGYSRIMAWAPDGSAVVLLDQSPDSTEASLRIVPIDGSGAGAPVSINVPDLSATLGFPNVGPSVAWLPATSP